MSDFINKVITLILIFVMLVLAPLLISYVSEEAVTERMILNEVNLFIDKVTDKKTITEYDLDDLYLGVNSHGGVYNVTVDRYMVIEEPLGNGDSGTRLVYMRVDDAVKLMNGEIEDLEDGQVTLNTSDVVKVHVEEAVLSPAKRLLWILLRIDEGNFEFSLAGTVR